MSKLTKALTAAAGNVGAERDLFLGVNYRTSCTILKIDENNDTKTIMDLSAITDSATLYAVNFSKLFDVLYTVEFRDSVQVLRAYKWTNNGLGALIVSITSPAGADSASFSVIKVNPVNNEYSEQIVLWQENTNRAYSYYYVDGTFNFQNDIAGYGAPRGIDFNQQGTEFLFFGWSYVGAYRYAYGGTGFGSLLGSIPGASWQHGTYNAGSNVLVRANNDGVFTYLFNGSAIDSIGGTQTGCAVNSDDLLLANNSVYQLQANGSFSSYLKATCINFPSFPEMAINSSNNVNSDIRYLACQKYGGTNRLNKLDTSTWSVSDLGEIFPTASVPVSDINFSR